jgi:hypothetical protein
MGSRGAVCYNHPDCYIGPHDSHKLTTAPSACLSMFRESAAETVRIPALSRGIMHVVT